MTAWRLAAAAPVVALAACGPHATPPATAPSSAPATVATTNAEVAPAPGSGGAVKVLPIPAAPIPPPATPDEAGCGLAKAAAFVGRKASPGIRADVAAAAGKRIIRWIGPGDLVTMDYSETRLNMKLDAAGTIVAAKCG